MARRSIRGVSSIPRLGRRNPAQVPRHELFVRITQLEMERSRRCTERESLITRLGRLNDQVASIEDELAQLMAQAAEREDAPLAPAASAAPAPAATPSGFRLRY